MGVATRGPATKVVLASLSLMVEGFLIKVTHSSFNLVGWFTHPYRLQMVASWVFLVKATTLCVILLEVCIFGIWVVVVNQVQPIHLRKLLMVWFVMHVE